MREAIRRLLIDAVEEVQVFDGPEIDYDASRVFEPFAVTTDLALPLLVVELQTPDAKPTDYAAPITRVAVWPIVPAASFVALDALKDAVRAALNEARFEDAGKQFYAEHYSTSSDLKSRVFDDAYEREIVFEVSDLSWLLGTTFAPDPIVALRNWTKARWPPIDPDEAGPLPAVDQVQTDPATWTPSVATPGIYWRLAAITRTVEVYPTFTVVEARIIGHILMPSPEKRLEWTRRVHEALIQERVLNLSDDTPMFVGPIGADSSAHQIRQGQITVIAQYSIEVPEDEAPQLETAVLDETLIDLS